MVTIILSISQIINLISINEANHLSDHSSGSFNPFEGQYYNTNNQFGQSSNPLEGQCPNTNNQFV